MLVRCCDLSFVSEKPTRREWGTTYDFLSTITSIGIDFQKKCPPQVPRYISGPNATTRMGGVAVDKICWVNYNRVANTVSFVAMR